MPAPTRTHVSDLRGATRLAIDAGIGITDIVERMHRTIQLRPGPMGRAAAGTTRGITGFVYRSVRGGMRLVGHGLDAGLAPAAALLQEGQSTPTRDAFLSAVNGVYGDYLARTGNPLAIEMSLRHRGRTVDPADLGPAFSEPGDTKVTGNLLVMVHGLCLNDRQWSREGHDHGAALADEFSYTPLYLRYNSGLPIADNGQALADLLERLTGEWPEPVRNLVIIGHSMGGLVARSACHHARGTGHAWPGHLRKLVFLGTPHHGAPLERGGHWLDFVMDLSPYSAPFTRIGKARSAGITDLRHGTITTGGHEHVPLPARTQCYALAATLGARRSLVSERLVGDGLVPLDSALGRHPKAAHSLRFPKDRQWVGYGMGHLELLNRPEVYSQLHAWMQESSDA
jgi:pimeloyl-ACP methyl ester carboxylesterase